MGELRAAGALADGDNIGRAGLQPFVDRDKAPRVELDPGLVEPNAGGVGARAAATRRSLPSIIRSPAPARTVRRTRRPSGLDRMSFAQNDLDALSRPACRADRLADVRLLAPQAAARLDDGDAAAEAAIGLRQLDPT